MAINNIEIEIQVNIGNIKPLLNFLELRAIFQAEKRQIDEYFSPIHDDFLAVRPVREWLRLRDANGKCSLNYKNWHFDASGKSNYCDEFETGIDKFEPVKKMLNVLNFKSIITVEKLRKIWTFKDYEIAIDSVKNLGDFVEIEYIGNDDRVEPQKITDEMINFLKNLECGKITRNYVGYPFQLLFPDEVKYDIL
ncbi:MAG: class IV adenylate cyclase [Patescibacteria group bacterium]|nr:class IV adenylate cyclase [Patescibacteria group bacterium]